MSTDAMQVITSFESLPPEEQQAVAAELFRRDRSRAQPQSSSADQSNVISQDDDSDLLPADEWVRRFRAWAESQPLRNPDVDTSRESIYE